MLASLACFPSLTARAGEAELKAGLGFSAEYNDNVQSKPDNQQTDIITHIKPFLSCFYEAGRVEAKIDYRGDYSFYVKGKDTDEYAHYLNAYAQAAVVENLFFIRVEEDLQPVYRDATRGEELIDDDASDDTVNRNRFTISPFFTLYPSDRTFLKFGYSFEDMRYSNSINEGDFIPDFGNDFAFDAETSTQHTLFASINHSVTDRVDLYFGGSATKRDSEDEQGFDNSFNRYQAYAGGKYALDEQSYIDVQAGPTYTDYVNGDSSLTPYVKAAFVWGVGRSVFDFSYTFDYTDNPQSGNNVKHAAYIGKWNKEFDRAMLSMGIGYHEYREDSAENQPPSATSDSDNRNSLRPFVNFRYSLTERLSFAAGGSMDMEVGGENKNGDRYYANTELKYDLSEKTWVSANYRYRKVNGSDQGSYSVNRIGLDFSMRF